MTNKLAIGDVFFANKPFEFGGPVSVGETKYVKGVSVVQVSDRAHQAHSVSKVIGYDPKTGMPIRQIVTFDAYVSKQRVGKEFVVESVTVKGGSDREGILSEPHIVARRLKRDGTYDPKGELITFVDSDPASSNFNTAALVRAHRRMTRTVSFV